MKRVLLTCARIPAALFLARALNKAGAEVHVADSFPIHLCKATNSVSKCHMVTSPMRDKVAYQKEILDIIRKYHIDIVIPTFEDSIFLSEFHQDISSRCNTLLSDFDLTLRLHNKHEFVKLAIANGLPVPTTRKYDSTNKDFEFIKKNKYIIKKIFSRSGSSFHIFEPGQNIPSNLQSNGEHIIQEFILGQMICTCSYVKNGKLLLHTAYQQLILTPNGAAAVCFQAIDNPNIQKPITEFVAKIGYNGWISFDIIQKNPEEFYYIECNPRLTVGISLFDPKILAQTILEDKHDAKFQSSVNIGAKAQMTLVSLECILHRLFRGSLQFKEFKNLLNSKDIIFDRSDMYPFVYGIVCYIYVKYVALKLKISFLYAATHDLEWN